MRAVQVYACDGYGSMLYDLASQSAESLFKSWNTCMKLICDVPRGTYTYLVENVLAKDFVPLRHQVYARYVNFFQGLFKMRKLRHSDICHNYCLNLPRHTNREITANCFLQPNSISKKTSGSLKCRHNFSNKPKVLIFFFK